MGTILLTSNKKLRKEIFQLWNYENVSTKKTKQENINDGYGVGIDVVAAGDDYSILIIIIMFTTHCYARCAIAYHTYNNIYLFIFAVICSLFAT